MLWSLFELIYYRLSAWWTWLDRSTSLIGWCTVGVPMVYYWCTNVVQFVYQWCTKVYKWCTLGVPMLYYWCTNDVLLVYQWCTIGVPIMYYWCTNVVLLVYQWWTIGVPMVYYWCILCAIVYCFSTAYCCVLSCNLDFSYVLRCDLLYSDQLVCTASVLLFHSLCTVWVQLVYSGLQTCTVYVCVLWFNMFFSYVLWCDLLSTVLWSTGVYFKCAVVSLLEYYWCTISVIWSTNVYCLRLRTLM